MKLWLLKDKKNHISGPYTEKEIYEFIKEGQFKGEEKISSYPSGAWKPLSSHSKFYDILLETLNPKKSDKNTIFDLEEEEVIEPTIIEHKPEKPKVKKPKKKKIQIKFRSLSKEESKEESEEESEVIEMEDIKDVYFKNLKKAFLLPFAVVIGLILIWFLFFNSKDELHKKKVRLIVPKINELEFFKTRKTKKQKKKLLLEDWDKKIQKEFINYFKDNVKQHLYTQDKLVKILEQNPNIPSGYYHLCLVHLELWPFTNQDYKDKQVLSKVFGYISQLDKGGIYSGLCSAVSALSRNQYKKAEIYIDSSLSVLSSVSESPVFFYYLKALVLKNSKRFSKALSYIQSSYRLIPKWIKAYMLEAQILYEIKNYVAAANTYKKIAQISPTHIPSQLRLGIIEYRYFKNYQNSEKRLKLNLVKNLEFIDPSILSESYLILARILFKQNDQAEALKNIKRAYVLDSSNPEILQWIEKIGGKNQFSEIKVNTRQIIYKGDIFLRKGDCIKAQGLYRKAYNLDKGKNALAAIQMAKCYWKMGISGQAIQWLKKAIEVDSQRMEAYFLLSDYLSKNYSFSAATDVLKAAHAQNKNNYEVFKGFALVALRQKNYKTAIGYAEHSLKFYTSDIKVYTLLSEAYHALKEYNKAYNYAVKAVEEDVNDSEGQISLAIALGLAHGFSRGEERFNKLIQTYPSVVEYRQALGKYYFQNDKYKQAIEVFSQIVEQNQEFKEALIYLGRIYNFYGRRDDDGEKFQEAVHLLTKAAILDPSDPNPSFYIGQSYMFNKQYLEAENQLEKTLELNQNYPLIHYYIGRVNFLQGGEENLDRALKFAKTEYQKNPSLSLAYVLSGDVYKKKAISGGSSSDARVNYELCTREYQKALKIRIKDIYLNINLIECYRGSGDLEAALQIINKLINSPGMSGYPELYREAGLVYEIKKEYEKAKASYQKYFSLSPGAPDRVKIERRLKDK